MRSLSKLKSKIIKAPIIKEDVCFIEIPELITAYQELRAAQEESAAVFERLVVEDVAGNDAHNVGGDVGGTELGSKLSSNWRRPGSRRRPFLRKPAPKPI